MYSSILVPLDGSETAEAILPEVETLARALNASICILRAYYASDESHRITARNEAEGYVQAVEGLLKARELNADSHTMCNADAADAIIEHCRMYGIDLIMMCTHGRGGIRKWLLGSIAEKVIHHAKCPVFLLRVI